MARLCVFGDSIAWGSWDLELGGWVARLRLFCNRLEAQGELELSVYNFGVDGDRVIDLVPRIGVECASTQPDAIIIAIGTNDSAHGSMRATDADLFIDSYRQSLEIARQFTPVITLLGLTNVDEDLLPSWSNKSLSLLNDKIRILAGEEDLEFIDPFGSMTPEDLRVDGLHPTAAGHQKIFELVAGALFPGPEG